MKNVVGVFKDRKEARRSVERLRSIGIKDAVVTLLSPGADADELAGVPTTETEQPGMGKAVGGVVGAAVGSSAGVGALVATSLLVPGVGPVIGLGIAAAGLLAGIVGGAVAGDKLENAFSQGLPIDELHIYKDALKQGRSVVIALAADEAQASDARQIMERSGAESLDAARETWWVGLRDAEEERYDIPGRSFKTDERAYRRGFEAALAPDVRGAKFDEARARLVSRYPEAATDDVFRAGYERGRAHSAEGN